MNQKKVIMFLVALIVLGIGFRILLLDREFEIDELDFVNAAIGFKETNSHAFYHSEQQPQEVSLWHPPFLVNLLSLSFMYGVSEEIARLPIFISSLFIMLFLFFLGKKFFGPNGTIIGLTSAALYAITYFAVASSSIIDIDLLASLGILGFIYAMLVYFYTQRSASLFIAPIALLFALWNRWSVAAFIYMVLAVYFLYRAYVKKEKTSNAFIKKYILTGLITALMFVISWTLYSLSYGVSFFSFVSHSARFTESQISNAFIYFSSFALNIAQIMRLFTIPFCILLAASFLYFAKRNEVQIRTVYLYTLSCLLLFLLVPRPAFGYPRYFILLLPGACILISLFIYETLAKTKLTKRTAILLIAAGVLSMLSLIILRVKPTMYQGGGLIFALNAADFFFLILCMWPLVFAVLTKGNKKQLFTLFLCALFLAHSLYFDAALAVNQQHNKEAAAYIKQITSESDIIIAPKSVAFYANRRFYSNDDDKPALTFSNDYLRNFFFTSFNDREMQSEFYWHGGVYSGLVGRERTNPSDAKLVVLRRPIPSLSLEKEIGNKLFIYRLSNNP